jgi:hypothetical protein
MEIGGLEWMGMVHGGIIIDTLPQIPDHSWLPLRIHTLVEWGLSQSMLGRMLGGIGIGFIVVRLFLINLGYSWLF